MSLSRTVYTTTAALAVTLGAWFLPKAVSPTHSAGPPAPPTITGTLTAAF